MNRHLIVSEHPRHVLASAFARSWSANRSGGGHRRGCVRVPAPSQGKSDATNKLGMMCSKRFLAAVVSAFAIVVSALPKSATQAQHFTRSEDIASSYDYIIIGGGTSGLTVADRLTEDENSTVLVIEYGYFEVSMNPDDFNLRNSPGEMWYNITSVGSKKIFVGAGCAVGGSSAINSMIFMRGTSEDYDRWGELGGYGSNWNWENMLYYFKKSATFTPPDAQLVKDHHIDYDIRTAWGGNGPVQASWPSFMYPGVKIMYDAWKGFPGMTFPKDGSEGKAGMIWIPTSVDPKNETRSYARPAHFDRVKGRNNYGLITGHKVVKINFATEDGSITAESVTATSRSGNGTTKVTANKEIILAAGTIHTPQILQLSGVGPRSLLESANITVVHDLPGVGQNFHDHSYFPMEFNCPLSVVGPSLIAQPSLSVISPDAYLSIASDLEELDPASVLPQDADETIIAGYTAQLKLMAAALKSNNTSWLQFSLRGEAKFNVPNIHALSRGSVNINISSPNSEPVVDYRALTNPIDIRVNVELLKSIKSYFARAGEIQKLSPVEITPGVNVTSEKDMTTWLKKALNPSIFHPVGTCAKMPLEYGGVVDEDLRVHGIQGLSVVDASIMPLVVGATTQATVYAVAEKALFTRSWVKNEDIFLSGSGEPTI
ncbi:hypothetical protein G7Y89_g14247 [Cudoniella acicularis]|uniref:Glucose-methanol-choline oxidoreductase N-terminal domain-containing protein n=1 Tax=Cudoniella acicularis TaxID=354080 RepID=A0A8H4R5P7_9HELO|nr:hypothetical protein G7Y89_g14247 [Cudoniella acicularis]